MIAVSKENIFFSKGKVAESVEWTEKSQELKGTKITAMKKRKRKGRGVPVKHNTVLCHLSYREGEETRQIPLFACISGFLIEINESLPLEPQALLDSYVAIIQPLSADKEISKSEFLKKRN